MLDLYHDKLVSDVKAIFGDSLETVDTYFPDDDENTQSAGIVINTPAALIEIETLDDAPDDAPDDDLGDEGDGRDALLCTVSIHCVLGTNTANLQRELWNFAAELMRGMKRHDFGLHEENAGGRPSDVNALAGRFVKGQAGYDSRVVSFNQVVYVGDEQFEPSWCAEQILWSRVPATGLAHIDDYKPLIWPEVENNNG